MPQSPALLPWRTVARNASLLLEVNRDATSDAARSPAELLAEVGLAEFAEAYPHELSGGMQQRVALVRAMALGAPLLLMDEPFAALDEITREDMRHLLARLCESLPTTVVFVTHSVPEAVYLSDRVVVLSPAPGTHRRHRADRPAPPAAARPRGRSGVLRRHQAAARPAPRGCRVALDAGGLTVRGWRMVFASRRRHRRVRRRLGGVRPRRRRRRVHPPAAVEDHRRARRESRACTSTPPSSQGATRSIGIALALAISIVVGAVLASSRFVEQAAQPVLVLILVAPWVAYFTSIVAWLGRGDPPVLFLVTLVAVPAFTFAAVSGLRSSDPAARELLASVNASRLEVLWRLRLPSALPGAARHVALRDRAGARPPRTTARAAT